MKLLAAVPPVVIALGLVAGCGSGPKQKKDDFFTSGSREADQRADQRMAKAEQLEGKSAASGDKSSSTAKEKAEKTDKGENKAEAKRTLYERLGGDEGLAQIVDDWTTRALADPRVNWERKGVKQGGFSLHYNKSVEWSASPENVKKLKAHMTQFLALATGGPSKYEGGEMKATHAGLHITNPEFDAAIGDLKASLDKMQVPNAEQKELLAIIESTRPQVASER